MTPLAPSRRRAVTIIVLVAALLSACAGERPSLSDTNGPSPSTSAAGDTTTAPANPPAVVAQAKKDSIQVFDDASAATATERFAGGVITAAETTSAPGIPIVFLATSAPSADGRLEVYLPVRPNGSTGWVRTDDVDLATVNYRVEVEITEHRLRVYQGDEVVLDEPIGVGTADTPSPGGIYYLKELLQPPDPSGAYGVYAYGLSGFSNELTSFNGGNGVIGIHGTNDPASIGTDVSHGCIRMNNDAITRMVDEIRLPLGTPVEISA